MDILPWDYQLVNGKCQMVERFDKEKGNQIPYLSRTRVSPLSRPAQEIKEEFIQEFLTPKPVLSDWFMNKSQKLIHRDIDLDKLFELQLSPLNVDFVFKDQLNLEEYEEVIIHFTF